MVQSGQHFFTCFVCITEEVFLKISGCTLEICLEGFTDNYHNNDTIWIQRMKMHSMHLQRKVKTPWALVFIRIFASGFSTGGRLMGYLLTAFWYSCGILHAGPTIQLKSICLTLIGLAHLTRLIFSLRIRRPTKPVVMLSTPGICMPMHLTHSFALFLL